MKIQRFTLRGFRGLWEFEADFGPDRSFLLFGRNGTGKTSLYRGIRFGVTGELHDYPHSDDSPHELSRHAALDSADPAEVEIEFADGGNTHTIRREIHSDGSFPLDCSSKEANRLISDLQRGLCFLHREKFSTMVEAAEDARWQNLSPLLGHEKLAKYREGIRKIGLNLTSDLDISRYQGEASRLESQVERLERRYQSRCEELEVENEITPSFLRREVLALVDEPEEEAEGGILTYDQLEAAESVEDLEQLDWEKVESLLGGSDELAEMSEALSLVNRREDLVDFRLFGEKSSETREKDEAGEGEQGLEDLLDLLKRLEEDEEIGHQVLHAEFFQSAKEVVAPLTDEPCPVCGLKPDNWDAVRESLAEREKELREVAKEKNRIEATAKRELAGLQTVAEEFDKHQEDYSLTAEEQQVREALTEGIDWLDLGVRRIGDRPAKGLTENERRGLDEAIRKIRQVRNVADEKIVEEKENLEEQIEKFEEAPARVRLVQVKALAEAYVDLRTTRTDYREVEAWLSVAKPMRDRVSDFQSEVSEAEGELSTDMLESVEDRVQDIFQTLTGNDQLEPQIDRFQDRRGGIIKADISIEDFYGQGKKPAREYLSESYRKALGLSIYFAGLEYRAPMLQTLVMDDITHSTDDRHRTGLADFLWDDLSDDWQLVLLSHEKEWFERLRTLFKSSAKTRRVLKWDIKAVQTKSDTWKPLRARAKEQIMAGEDGAGNVLRMALAEFLDEVCERFNVKVPYRRDPEQVSFEMKRNRLVKRLKEVAVKGEDIIDPTSSAVRRFETSQRLVNLASHLDTKRKLSGPALHDALEDFEKFSDLFVCTNKISGSRCEWKLSELRNTSDDPYECPKCNRQYDV